MKIHSSVELVSDTYLATVGIQAISPVEEEAIARFGEPVVEVGGTFTGSLTRPGAGAPTDVSYVLPARQYSLPTNFPVQQAFSLLDYVDADVRAETFRTTILARITAARSALLARVANYVGETLSTIS